MLQLINAGKCRERVDDVHVDRTKRQESESKDHRGLLRPNVDRLAELHKMSPFLMDGTLSLVNEW